MNPFEWYNSLWIIICKNDHCIFKLNTYHQEISENMKDNCIHIMIKILNDMILLLPCCINNNIHINNLDYTINQIKKNIYAIQIFNTNYIKSGKYIPLIDKLCTSYDFYINMHSSILPIIYETVDYKYSIDDNSINCFVDFLLKLLDKIVKSIKPSEPCNCDWFSPTAIYMIIDELIDRNCLNYPHSVKLYTKKKINYGIYWNLKQIKENIDATRIFNDSIKSINNGKYIKLFQMIDTCYEIYILNIIK